MKKLLFSVGAVLIFSLGLVGVALADNGPHGGYTDLTDKCAGCHRAHTGLGASLLTSAASPTDKSAFCYTCHSGGLGAYTDVKNGVFASVSPAPGDENTSLVVAGTPLKGGGFDSVRMNPDNNPTGPLTLSVTSRHTVDGGSKTVWGYGAVTSPTANLGVANVALSCVNCHNPHGGAGTGNTATYRILKGGSTNNTPLFVSDTITLTASVDIPEENGAKKYGIDDANPMTTGYSPYSYFGQHSANAAAPNQTTNIYAKMTAWCIQCHTRYNIPVSGDPTTTPSGDAVFQYRHALTSGTTDCTSACHTSGYGIPDSAPTPGCITCHVSHGTGVRMGSDSGSVPWPGGATSPSGDQRSSLLRLDNRGVCQFCHAKT